MIKAILLSAAVAAPQVNADTLNCFSTAAAAHAAAIERDSGTPIEEAAGQVAITMRGLDQREMEYDVLKRMVRTVYATKATKDQVYSHVLETCQELTTNHGSL